MTVHALARVASMIALGVVALPAAAGTIDLEWDPVPDSDLAGYRIYYGTSPGAYTAHVDVGNVTRHTLSGVADCTTWYVAVKAVDTSGLESASFSNEISGWPRPRLSSATPASGIQGQTLDVTLAGSNFMSGAAVTFANPGVSVSSVNVSSCSSIVARVSIGGGAALGPTNIEAINPDQVYGTGAGLFTIATATVPPSIVTHPASQTVNLGQSATFTVSATGTPPLQYQWRKNGSAVAGATSTSYTTPPATAGDDGATYRCVVTNAAGSATSNAATLTVQDGTGPVVSQVRATNVTSGGALITWTTDEPADSTVYYRAVGDTSYRQTSRDTTMVTSHSAQLQGLAAATTYEYHVRSVDDSGNGTTSSPDGTFTTLQDSRPGKVSNLRRGDRAGT